MYRNIIFLVIIPFFFSVKTFSYYQQTGFLHFFNLCCSIFSSTLFACKIFFDTTQNFKPNPSSSYFPILVYLLILLSPLLLMLKNKKRKSSPKETKRAIYFDNIAHICFLLACCIIVIHELFQIRDIVWISFSFWIVFVPFVLLILFAFAFFMKSVNYFYFDKRIETKKEEGIKL